MKLIIIPNVLVWSQGFQKGIICPVSMAESQPKQVNSLIPIFLDTVYLILHVCESYKYNFHVNLYE